MKKLATLLAFILLLLVSTLKAQELAPVLTHEMTPEEELRRHLIGRDFTPTEPPPSPARSVAEFEEMQSVIIAYPFGIPMSLIVEMSQDCRVMTIVENTGEQQTVIGQYISAGVNTANCEWLIAPSNSYWTRDYGPWFVADGNNEIAISDFPYNRPRPFDDNIPVLLAEQLDIPLYGMNVVHTGGNWMDDGMGIAASTELVWEENANLTHQEIDTMVWDYLGIETYNVLPDPMDDYIDHIDCWGKFLDVDKILIGQVPQTDYRYADYEYLANYFSLRTSSYGTPYQVIRVYTPGTYPYTPYTNSLILNKKVFVPITGSQWDDEALAVYEEAMPGYEIIGIMSTGWVNTDALHCRAKGIADVGMLYINHMPLLGDQDFQFEWELMAEIVPYSDMSVIPDSLLCYYKVDDGGYQAVPLENVSGSQYKATIPFALPGSEISYYLHAVDLSGRRKNHPYIGSPDPHVFTVGVAEDAIVGPDSLVFLTFDDMMNGKEFMISNFTDGDLTINELEHEGFGLFHWFIEPWNLEVPFDMTFGETLTLNVKIGIPLDPVLGYRVIDTLDIQTEFGHHKVILKVDSDLLSSLAEKPGYSSIIESVAPNPFSSETRISFSLDHASNISLSVYNLQGQVIRNLAVENFTAGNHEMTWDGKNDAGSEVAPGIYLLKLETDRGVDFKKLILSN